MNNLTKLAQLKLVVLARLKTVVAALGTLLNFLYVLDAAHPNHYVELAIGVLTVLGVHQTKNL